MVPSRKTGESDGRRFSLVVATDGGYSEREFLLRAKNEAEATRWYKEMQTCACRDSVDVYRERAQKWLSEHGDDMEE